MFIVISFLLIGCLSGLLAGLFGIGGGVVVVPAMWYLMPYLNIPESIQMPMILGTSFGCIVITASFACYRHYKLGNINFKLVQVLVLSLMLTAMVVSGVVTKLDRYLIIWTFASLLIFMALRMLFKANKPVKLKQFSLLGDMLAGIGIGVISCISGVGGGSFVVPFLTNRGFEIKNAIGTASLCTLSVGISSAIGYILRGYGSSILPEYSLGFIYLPALVCITFASYFTTQLGVKLVNILPVSTLHKIFAVFLIGLAISMFFK